MLSPEKIIELIREDAPCVFHILHELHLDSSSSLTDEDIELHYTQQPHQKPTADQLLEILKEYSGDNYDTHHWCGRYCQMLIDKDKVMDTVIDTALIVHKGIEHYLTTEKLIARHKVISIAQEYFGNSSNFNKFIHSL